ncbi:hypothetical protein LEP1GSC021_3090 [Leptospira noguchii str. 1993005606]|nr:hypothetical protein LEP1GSC021_3090 [Leptospira noguchii str. 1993005606]
MEKFGRFFSIRKTYFLQVKRLVGTLEKYALILKSSSIVGLVMIRATLSFFIHPDFLT